VTRAGASALAALLVASLSACTESCPRESDDAPKRYTDGTTSADRTYYETNDWKARFVDFPAGRRIALVHGLRHVPIELRSYLAFDEYPFPSKGNGFVAESAGNQVLIEDVNEEYVQVRNDTCEHFFLRLVASTVTTNGDDGAGGAGGAAP
jgi:hypothetical protein